MVLLLLLSLLRLLCLFAAILVAGAARSPASDPGGRCPSGGRRPSPAPALPPTGPRDRPAVGCRGSAFPDCRPRRTPAPGTACPRPRRLRGPGQCWGAATGRRPPPHAGSA